MGGNGVYVVATAGHVDHGKSTLVHRLTGMWPDRLAEEQRRGLTIDLGFAWTDIDGRQFAFVDVPGHERFVANMLAGVGPVPAVMFVVAATEGWMPQSDEHLDALDALGVRNVAGRHQQGRPRRPGGGHRAGARSGCPTRRSCSAPIWTPCARSCSHSSTGCPHRIADADVRLWVDRSFTVRGAGTVVTGTLAAGTIRVGDELEHDGRRVIVRGLQSLQRDQTEVAAVARVAVNLRGVDRQRIGRGDTIRTPGAWLDTAEIDVALRTAGELHRELVLHIGSAAVPVHVRPLGYGRRAAAAGAATAVAHRRRRAAARSRRTSHRVGHRGARCAAAGRCVAAVRRGSGPRNWRPAVPIRQCVHVQNDLRAMGFPVTGLSGRRRGSSTNAGGPNGVNK